jgi:transglutaminase-like putative cysteine protease
VTRRHVQIGCDFVHQAQVDTSTVFQVAPLNDRISDEVFTFSPSVDSHEYHDIYGNRCLRVVMPAGRSEFNYRAMVDVPDETEDFDLSAPEIPPHDLPDDVLVYTMPSRYCLPDMLGNEAWSRFAQTPPGYGRVQAICDHVNSHLQFAYGSSYPTSTAADVNASGFGVCRDFTHLAISFCRALNIPARYVFGYLADMDVPVDPAPNDFAAWMEVWLGDRWWTFDPRNNVRRKGRILIGRGRDASDVAMVTTFGGPLLESMFVIADEVFPAGELHRPEDSQELTAGRQR